MEAIRFGFCRAPCCYPHTTCELVADTGLCSNTYPNRTKHVATGQMLTASMEGRVSYTTNVCNVGGVTCMQAPAVGS